MQCISVVIPAYRAQSTISRALESVFIQQSTYYDLEVLLVLEDGIDNTIAEAKKIAEQYNALNILIIVKNKNTGPSAARNAGIAVAKGEWIAFLDADDYWLPGKLQAQFDTVLSQPNVQLLGCTKNGFHYKHKWYVSPSVLQLSYSQLLWHNYFVTSGVFIKKSTLLSVGGFNPQRKYSEDYEVWLKICLAGQCLIINKPYVHYASGGMSSRLWPMEKGELETYSILHKAGNINTIVYYSLVCYSYLKFIRRFVIACVQKGKGH